MRLVSSAPFPVVALGLVSLATGIGMATQTMESIPVDAEIAFSPEPIEMQQDMQHEYSEWEGTYVCGQGLSSMKLTIDVDALGAAMVRYDFGPTPSNPVIPKTGAFILTGSLLHAKDGSFTGEFEPRAWIVHPDTYWMLPLSIESDDGLHMRGRIHHDSCRDFQATRTK
jgi:hypothetical protein